MSIFEKVKSVLEEIANNQNIANFELILDKEVLNGDGFLSEFYTGTVKNKENGKQINAYIKFPPPKRHVIIPVVFGNEFTFYDSVFPELSKFQMEKGIKEPFTNIPQFYCGCIETNNEHIAMENLNVQNYVLYDKTKFLDESHLKAIFETYGKYHALTFAFKAQNREKHDFLTGKLDDRFARMHLNPNICQSLKRLLNMVYEDFKETDENKAKKVKTLMENIEETAALGAVYRGKYSALTHGDCWSNNMLFKYDENGNIEDLKLVDHQLCRDSTPVHDLSYFFYAGASQKDFNKLEEYLKLYYESFKKFSKELQNDPETALPFAELKSDWKKYSVLGIRMAFLVWQAKLTPKAKIQQMSKKGELLSTFSDHVSKLQESGPFRKIICDLMDHAIEHGIV